MTHILWLDEIGEADRARVGGKAFALARLRRAGLPVPDGFVLTASGQALEGERRAALVAASERLGGALAVRSSSTAEDLDSASFAGQYRTLLDVRGAAAVVEAARLCLDSANAAAGYAQAVGASAAGAMAVLVQRFIEAGLAGVAFTRDPHEPSRLMIESVEGLGEALVSGRATPERYVIERASGALVEGPAQPRVDAPTLAAVAELARRAEAAFGAPQDVEWAVAGDGVALLQARPITVEAEAPDARIRLLTRANVGEVLPGPVTPLTESTVLAFLEHGFREVAGQAGLLPPDATRFLVLQRRRLYLNLSLCVEVMARLPGVSASDAERLILGGGATRGSARRLDLRAALGLLGVGARLARTAARLPAAVRRAEDAVAGLCPAEEIASAGPDRLAALLREAQVAGRLIGTTHIAVSGAAAFRLAGLGRLVGGEGDDAAARVNRLVAGLDGVESAGPTLALEALARQARARLEWSAWLAQPAAEGAARLQRGEVPLGLAAELQAFLRRYGHRAVSEGELGAPAWEDDPTPVLLALQGLLKAPRSADFTRQALAEARRADEDALLARAGAPRRALLRAAFEGAQRGVRERERTKSLAIALVHHLRRLARAGGRWLAHAGTLAREDDVLFLTLDELVAALEGASVPAAAVARRRRRQQREAALPAPRELDLGDPDGALAGGDGPLAGVGVSAGVGAGPARVLQGAEAPYAEPGEVIVAPVLDAALGPLLATSAAAVAEIGGMLSHGSVVARELGVPCVVDVRDATRRIRTGDQVLVDGGTGRVRIVPAAAATAAAAGQESRSLRPADPGDEAFHALESDPRARESVYLNVQDPAAGLALVASLGVKRGGRGEALLALALPDGRVLFGLERVRAQLRPPRLAVGDLAFDWDRLRLVFDGALAPHEPGCFPPGPLPLLLAPRTVRVRFDLACLPATPAVDFCEDLPEDVRAALRPLGSHHVEQSGRWRGTLDVDGTRLHLEGTGSRDHSWGLRDWEAADHWRLFTLRLGEDMGVHALAVSVRGRRIEGGFVSRAGHLARVTRIEHVSQRDGAGRVRSVQLELRTDAGEVLRLHGTVERTITVPVQLERRPSRHVAGRPYRLLLHENFTRWEGEGRTGHGMAEMTERPA